MLIEPDIVTRSNRKTLSISITREGGVVIKAPNRLPAREINKFLIAKQDWIKTKLEQINRSKDDNKDIINYQKLLVFGTKCQGFRTSEVKTITLDEYRLLIPSKISDDKLMRAIKKWYIIFAANALEERINYIQKKLKLVPKSLKIVDARSRWGSCNGKGEIRLNWRVVMLRPRLVDYVLVHELAHLVEFNHSAKFWQVVGLAMPDWLALRKEIKEQNYLLDLF